MKNTYIDEWYQDVVDRLKGGSLYGEPIDFSNIKMVAVAAYYMGRLEASMEANRTINMMLELQEAINK